ncbi:MAG: hypothetical protein A2514_11385 [Gammaproteobacteria bacterium RIFOXYD12_FULL_61_37]|nr:MAG: hypothetical protein A2514_11385 [Gammaproteobacteria bacterium RIFOXYD12_FULL_61_37]
MNADVIADSMARRKGEGRPSPETQWQAALAAEEMRWALVSQRVSFATETVMSDLDRWPRFILEAKSQGYRIVLFFITTRDPSINVGRVAERVLAGGHAVDQNKIVNRFHKVMQQVLPVVLNLVDEALLFDNSEIKTGAVAVLAKSDGRLTPLVLENLLPDWAAKLLKLH